MMMWMYSNSRSRVKISVIGFDCAFLAIAQMPTSTCLPGFEDALQSESMPSFALLHRSISPYGTRINVVQITVSLAKPKVNRFSKSVVLHSAFYFRECNRIIWISSWHLNEMRRNENGHTNLMGKTRMEREKNCKERRYPNRRPHTFMQSSQ